MTRSELSPAEPAVPVLMETPRASAEPAVPAVRKKRSIVVYLSIVWIVAIVGAALLADVLPFPSYTIPVDKPRLGPQWGSVDLLLGTDTLGRSMLARVVHGAQVSLVVGAVATLAGFTIGSFIGLLGGYFGKRTDAATSLLADAMLAFPPLILLLALTAVLTPSLGTILLGLSIVAVPAFIRLARANTLSWSAREFVRAARNMGATDRRILFREVLPNVAPPLASYLPVVMAALIVAEGSLSFLGMGVPPPQPSWGGMINDGKDALAEAPHLVVIPSMAIFLTVFALNQVGDHLRARFDRTVAD